MLGNYKEELRERFARAGLYVDRGDKRGFLRLKDITAARAGVSFRNVFDVGANHGQSATEYLRTFPLADVWCFEPSLAACEILTERLSARPRVTIHRLAFGAELGTATLMETPSTDFSYIVQDTGGQRSDLGGSALEVEVETIDRFCRRFGVDRIDLLKIDTEGYDLEVLRGASEMLAGGRIDFIQAEVSLSKQNRHHASLEDISEFVRTYDYDYFGIYDQIPLRARHFGLERADVIYRRAEPGPSAQA